MAKGGGKGPLGKLIALAAWIVGVLVSLAVGFGMAWGTLTVPYVQSIVPLAGWIVVILTLLGVIFAIVRRF